MRYTLKFDHQPRIKIDSRGYRSVSEAMHLADRAVLSGKCTRAEVIGADDHVLRTSTREQVQANMVGWTAEQIRWWKSG